MKKTVLILLAFFTLTSVFAQESVNDYKYVIIPNKFDFLKEVDQYRLNSLTKFLFEKYNFEALMEDDEVFPDDYSKNNCLALKANVLKESSMFKTKLIVQLKNCKEEVVYTSTQGESREKNYKVAYNKALRKAFSSIEALNYRYTPKKTTIKHKKLTKTTQPKAIKEMVTLPKANENVAVLYAKKTKNGFRLVDKTTKIVYKIKNTGLSNVFLVEDKNAILYKLDANWILEFYKNEKLQTKILYIKF